MLESRILAMILAGTLPCISAYAEPGSTAEGELAFHRNCAACHSLEKGQNAIGPSLFSIYGQKSAQAEGYSYSPALRNLDLTWSAANLDVYIADAQKLAPGAKMWIKLPDIRTRQEIIDFLKAQGISLTE